MDLKRERRTPYFASPSGLVWLVSQTEDKTRHLEFPAVPPSSPALRTHWRTLEAAVVDPDCPFRLAQCRLVDVGEGAVRAAVELPSGWQRRPRASELRSWYRWLAQALGVDPESAGIQSCSVVEPGVGKPILLASPILLDIQAWAPLLAPSSLDVKETPRITGRPAPPIEAALAPTRSTLATRRSHGVAGVSTREGNPDLEREGDLGLEREGDLDPEQAEVDTIPIPSLRARLRRTFPTRRTPGIRTLRKGALMMSTAITVCLAMGLGAAHGLFTSPGAELRADQDAPAPISVAQPTSDAVVDEGSGDGPVSGLRSSGSRVARPRCPSLTEASERIHDLLTWRAAAMESSRVWELPKVQGWRLTILDLVDLGRRADSGEGFAAPNYRVEVNSLACSWDAGDLTISLVTTVGGTDSEGTAMRAAALRMVLRGDPLRVHHIQPF